MTLSKLKLEVGRYYRTRDGHKARIYALDGDGDVVHGAIWFDAWRMVSWDSEGHFYVNSGTESPNDLVAEWEEPKALTFEVGKFYRTRNGEKARVYALDGGAFQTVHGAIWSGGGWCSTTWQENGSRNVTYLKDRNDLVAEWYDTPEPITLGKRYKTRSGLSVTLYTVSANSIEPVHGCVHEPAEDSLCSWSATGKFTYDHPNDWDLVEVEGDT